MVFYLYVRDPTGAYNPVAQSTNPTELRHAARSYGSDFKIVSEFDLRIRR